MKAPFHSPSSKLSLGLSLGLLACTSGTQADTPANWTGNNHISAYVLEPAQFELSGTLLRVDDNIDLFNFRDELLSSNTRLAGDSGVLDGNRFNLKVGVWRGLELFYSRQTQDLTVTLAPVASASIVELDNALETTSTEYGFNWVIYEQGAGDGNSPWRSASLQISRIENSSNDFGGKIDRVQLNANTTITLDPPQLFGLNRLKDEGWQTRLIYSFGLTQNTALSIWGGYGRMESSSGTGTEIEFPSIANAFRQTFDAEETIIKAGASLNWQRFERFPVQVGYEYIKINDRQLDVVSSNSTLLPSFLRGSNLNASADTNHTLYANVSYWITPQIYAGAGGKLFRNQFVGTIPHYNNPLSGRFSETAYGYAELTVGIKFGMNNR